MPPRALGTSLRGGRSTRKGFKLALPELTIKKDSSSTSGSPTQAGSSTQKPNTKGSSIQIISIKHEFSTQEPPKNPTSKQTMADYAFPIQTLQALQDIGLTKLPRKTQADIASESDDDSEIDLQILIQQARELKTISNAKGKQALSKQKNTSTKTNEQLYLQKQNFNYFADGTRILGQKSLQSHN